jgi:hypothetical protein
MHLNKEHSMPKQDPNHQHHQDAARHYEQAALHHKEAARHYESGNHEAAGYHAHIAHGHTIHALHHSEEAAKQHADIALGSAKKS